ncbi:MAG TPA: thiamine phosphate synthase [Bacteroidales bacterium]|nr:thiamine phosphate synthase [Bacteroidales bacterium]
MKLIVISPPETLSGEIDFVNTLLKEGLTKFHLRKPNLPTADLIQYLKKIDSAYISNVVVHYDFEMLRHFPQVGFHFNQYSLNWLAYKGFTHKSYSAHSFREILRLNTDAFDYIFISPVFESISKPGYYAGFNLKQIRDFTASGCCVNPIVALGGVDENNIASLQDLGLYGAAVLGAIWTPFQAGASASFLVDKFLRMKQVCQPDLMF